MIGETLRSCVADVSAKVIKIKKDNPNSNAIAALNKAFTLALQSPAAAAGKIYPISRLSFD